VEEDLIILKVTAPAGQAWSGTRTFLYSGPSLHHIVSGTDNREFHAVLPVAEVTWGQFLACGGAAVPL